MSRPAHLAVAARYPLRDIAGETARWVGIVGSLVTAAVGYGILTAVQGDAVTGLLGLLPGIVTGVANTVTAFRVAERGAQVVTPMIDPRDSDGTPLVRAA
jgi:hypothetical protein